MAQFFYDGQIRRFVIQFARIFSNFQVEYGPNQAGQGPGSETDTLVRVPCRYGDASRQAQTIIQNNSANDMPSAPMMSYYITGLKYDRPRIQDPTFVSTINVRQRTYDQTTETYETTQGNAFTIDRLMPVPFALTMNLDIWTTNTNQKWQLLEQIGVLFNPALELQSTDSYIDWTSLSVVELIDINYNSRTVPMGTDNPIDITTLTFVIPIWISSPAKIKKLGVVERIIANMYNGQGDFVDAITNSDLLLGTRQKFTPFGYQTLLIGNRIQALAQNQVVDEPNASLTPPDNPQSNLLWQSIIGMYGVMRPGISLMSFEQPDGSEVYGTITYDPTDDRYLLFNVDTNTVPSNTLNPVNAVINPLASGPDQGLAPAATGQRYLLTEATGSDNGYAQAWAGVNGQPLVANANDIIEYDGDRWIIYFDSTSSPDNIQYVTNITTEIQYRWENNMWVKSFQGLYPGGQWSLTL